MEEQVACLRRLQVAYEEGRKGERESGGGGGGGGGGMGKAEGDRHGR